MTINSNKYTNLMLVTLSALLGEVEPNLRGVAVDWNDSTILIYFYNNGEISNELESNYYAIGGEIIANYSDGKICEKIIRLDSPARLPEHEYWVYRRKEPPG